MVEGAEESKRLGETGKGESHQGLGSHFYKGLGFCSKRSLEALVECERRTVEHAESQQDTKHRN